MTVTTRRHLTRKTLLPIAILVVLGSLSALALLNPPNAAQAPRETGPHLTVATREVQTRDYQVIVPSFGTVRPRTQSSLFSQVAGEIVWVSPQFRDGGVFDAGDTLLRIDARDYEADVEIAAANLLSARQTLAEEEALSAQALADWQRLGDDSEASALVLRKPQLLAAQARVASAQASLRKAELNLERSTVRAPFAGRILTTDVDLGEVIGTNSLLAEIYATDYVEVRLPLANSDLDFVELPEPGNNAAARANSVPVRIHSSLSAGSDWPGFLVRTEGAIDDSSQQLHVVAQVDDPFLLDAAATPGRDDLRPLKIGEYVTAQIDGRQLSNVIVISNDTIYQGSYVYIVQEHTLQRREVSIAWQNANHAIIADGLQEGDALVTTALGQVTSGTPVAVLDEPRGKGRRPVSGQPPADAERPRGTRS